MRIAVAGATGHIGALTVSALEREGEVIGLSRSLGVDLLTGEGLADALAGVEAVVDTTNAATADAAEAVAYFGSMTRNLLAAEHRAGVRHHVLLSIVGVSRVEGNAHYAGKREQERLVAAGPVPWTIVPATQFHDFAAMVAGWTEHDGVATIAPLLVQPIAPGDVAYILAEIATGEPQGRYADVVGPEPQDLVDMARRTNDGRGHRVKLVPTWSGVFGESMAGNVLLPGSQTLASPQPPSTSGSPPTPTIRLAPRGFNEAGPVSRRQPSAAPEFVGANLAGKADLTDADSATSPPSSASVGTRRPSAAIGTSSRVDVAPDDRRLRASWW